MNPSQPPTHGKNSPARMDLNLGVHCVGALKKRSRTGFTLIEILIVISVAALLIGLIAIGAIKAQDAASRNRAQSMMRSLIGAQEEYKSQSGLGLAINHDNISPSPINWSLGPFAQNAPGATGSAGAGGLSSSERFVVACFLYEPAENILQAAAQGANTLVDDDGDGFLELRDPWDNEIHYRNDNTHDGGMFDGIPNDDLPQSRSPYFVSAGKDGDIGTNDDINTIELEG